MFSVILWRIGAPFAVQPLFSTIRRQKQQKPISDASFVNEDIQPNKYTYDQKINLGSNCSSNALELR